jgi:hypothetical protein
MGVIEREHINRVQALGYTDREAMFLAVATLNAGVFIRRQFNRYSTGTGKVTDKFCRKVLERKHAGVVSLGKGNVYEISPVLHQQLGSKRPGGQVNLRRTLMGLDFVLAHKEDYRFLPLDEHARQEYFAKEWSTPDTVHPASPIGIDRQNRLAFTYVDDGVQSPPSFPNWLENNRKLIERVGEVDVVYVATSESAFLPAERQFRSAFPARRGLVPEVQTYFATRSDIETNGIGTRTPAELDAYRELITRYSTPNFEQQYQEWLTASSSPSGIRLLTFRIVYGYTFFGHV